MSVEKYVVENMYNARTVVQDTYEDVIAHIKDNRNTATAAAVLDVNVARFHPDIQDQPGEAMHRHDGLSLAIVEEIMHDIPIFMLVPERINDGQDGRTDVEGCGFTGVNLAQCIKEREKMIIDPYKSMKYQRPIDIQTLALDLSLGDIISGQ